MSDPLSIQFDLKIYTIDTLQRAALKFTDACSFDFRSEGDVGTVTVSSASESFELQAESLVAKYRNEVLDQHLRAVVAKETESERNLILAYAFSNTKLIAS